LRLAGGCVGGAADARASEARRGGPERHCGTYEGGRYLQRSPGETSDGGRGRGDCGIGGGQGNGPSGGHDDGSGAAVPEGLCGGRGRKCIQGLLVVAAWRAAVPPRNWWRHRWVLGLVLAPDGQPHLRPPDPPAAPAPAPLEASSDDIEVEEGEAETMV
jgi:hypothetical protein